jgi:hypothetical protein
MVDLASELKGTDIELKVPTSRARAAANGYALWEFNGGNWRLRKDASLPGASPSNPPRIPGIFDGQIRATESVVLSE